MHEDSLKEILDRGQVSTLTQEHFAEQLAAVRDMVNYGTHLLVRAPDPTRATLTDVIACSVLLKQVVMMLDSFEVLATAGALTAASIPARAGLEASLLLEFLLVEDSDRRARYYYVGSLRRDRWTARRLLGTNGAADDFGAMLAEVGAAVQEHRTSWRIEAEKQLRAIDSILERPGFREIDADFESHKIKGKFETDWYKLLGEPSIRHLAITLARRTEFELLHSSGSRVVHGVSHHDHIWGVPGGFNLIPIRHLKNIRASFHAVITLALKTYGVVIRHYRPDEEAQFKRKYLEDWREAFRSIKQVNYDF